MKYYGPLLLALAVVLVGCPQPQLTLGVPEGRNLVLHLTSPSRTLGPDWSTLVQTYQATLKSQDGYADVTGSVSGSNTLVLTGVRTGTWDLEVQGLDGATQVVAQAKLPSQAIPGAGAITVLLLPTQTATGSYSFSLRFPWFTVVGDRITRITGQLTKPDLTPVGTGFDQAPVDLGTGTAESVFAATGIASGSYRLALTLYRGTEVAKYVLEAINVYDNVVSNRWIDSTGTPQTARLMTSAEFSPTNTDLADLTLEIDGVPLALTPAFDPATKLGYSLDVDSPTLTQALVPTATASLPGTSQHLEWSTDGGTTWTTMVTGVAEPAFTLVKGTNTIEFKVFVNRNGVTTSSVYEVAILKKVRATGVTLSPPTLSLATNAAPVALTSQVLPLEADDQSVTFTSSDPALATVDPDGTVHPLLPGTVTITATSTDGGFVASTTLTLTPSQYLLKATNGAFWTELTASPVKAPAGTIAIGGNDTTLWALGPAGSFKTFNGGVWTSSPFTAPVGTQWFSVDSKEMVICATTTRVYYYEAGFWASDIPVPPVGIQGLVTSDKGVIVWGTDGGLWSFDGTPWTKLAITLPVGTTSVVGGTNLIALTGTQVKEYHSGVWSLMPVAAQPQTASSAFALGQFVSLIVR